MEIEPSASNELITSGSTNYSNNTHLSIESNNINITSAKMIFCPEQNNSNNQIKTQIQNQVDLISNRQYNPKNELIMPEKSIKLFDYNFESKDELLSFAGEYLNEIYSNLLLDEQELQFKPKLGYMNDQNDINEQMRAILIDWLIEVHYRFRLKSETLFQTVWIIDTYLS